MGGSAAVSTVLSVDEPELDAVVLVREGRLDVGDDLHDRREEERRVRDAH